jgi:hypothetical protein
MELDGARKHASSFAQVESRPAFLLRGLICLLWSYEAFGYVSRATSEHVRRSFHYGSVMRRPEMRQRL